MRRVARVTLALALSASSVACAASAPAPTADAAATDRSTAGAGAPQPGAGGGPATTATTTTTFAATTSTAPSALRPVEPATCAFPIASVSAAAPEPSTTTTAPPDGTTPPPVDARSALARFSSDPRVAGTTRSVSVWIDGLGEVATENPDQQLIPASNQKLLTALAALRLLDPNERFHTDLVATGPITDGVLQGDLVVVGGGDPTLTRTGEHSLESLAQAVSRAGVRRIDGRLIIDDSRYDAKRAVDGWAPDWPRWVGSLSALAADHNTYRKDDTFLGDPALGNGELLRFALTAGGIEVTGGVARGEAASGLRLASIDSATLTEIVTAMLFRSDNFIAEMLVKELGYRRHGRPGTTPDGLAAVRDVTSQLCAVPGGADHDGSGFSTENRHSARDLRRMLLAAQLQPWGPAFISTMSLAGQLDSLGGRLDGPRTTGNVRAKGGSLSSSKTLSGYLTTASGRHVVFSILLNNGNLSKAEDAIDDFVTNLASLRV